MGDRKTDLNRLMVYIQSALIDLITVFIQKMQGCIRIKIFVDTVNINICNHFRNGADYIFRSRYGHTGWIHFRLVDHAALRRIAVGLDFHIMLSRHFITDDDLQIQSLG